jgi:hypothetical protein
MEEEFQNQSETINALITVLGAIVMATVRQLDASRQADFAVCLASAARAQSAAGDTTGAMLLQEMHRMASLSGR